MVLLPPERGVEGAVEVPPPALPELLELPELPGRPVSFGSAFGSGLVVVVVVDEDVLPVDVLPVVVLPVLVPVLPVEPVRLPGL